MIRTLGGRAAAMRVAVVPEWLAEVVRPRPAPVPWPEMIRAALGRRDQERDPADETLKPVTEAIRALLGVFGTGQRLAANGQRA